VVAVCFNTVAKKTGGIDAKYVSAPNDDGAAESPAVGLNRDFCFLAGSRCCLAVHDSRFDPPQQDHNLLRLHRPPCLV
jgi:hypothetical protein